MHGISGGLSRVVLVLNFAQIVLRLSRDFSQFESRKVLKVCYLNRTSPTLQHDFLSIGQGRTFSIAKFVRLLFQ